MAAPDLKKFLDGLGAISEMALVFYRSAIQSHATPIEARELTTAYLAAMMMNGKKEDKPENDG